GGRADRARAGRVRRAHRARRADLTSSSEPRGPSRISSGGPLRAFHRTFPQPSPSRWSVRPADLVEGPRDSADVAERPFRSRPEGGADALGAASFGLAAGAPSLGASR